MNFSNLPFDNINKLFAVGGLALLLSLVFCQLKFVENKKTEWLNYNQDYEAKLTERLQKKRDTLMKNERIRYFTKELHNFNRYNLASNSKAYYKELKDSISILQADVKGLIFELTETHLFDLGPLISKSINYQIRNSWISFLLFSISLMTITIAGLCDWYKEHEYATKDKEYIHKKLHWFDSPCESCGTLLKHDLKAQEGSRYCTHCATEDGFTEPDLTYIQMVARVKNKMRSDGYRANDIVRHIKILKSLDRWKPGFRW